MKNCTNNNYVVAVEFPRLYQPLLLPMQKLKEGSGSGQDDDIIGNEDERDVASASQQQHTSVVDVDDDGHRWSECASEDEDAHAMAMMAGKGDDLARER
jgi:hypothetical protein